MTQDLTSRLADLHACVEAEFPKHLETTKEFLRIRSVSADTVNLRLAADYLTRQLESIGAKVELVKRDQVPIVYARLDEHKEKTLLIYGMYDVQPVAGQTWSSPPFEAVERNVEGIGRCLVARGACNSKGPLIGFLNALAAIRRSQGQLPINLLFTIEGEEEMGSAGLDEFYREKRAELRAEAAFEPFWAEYGTDVDRPTVALA
jgi:acetylornithine deacetylase/succinyl-diaminopimelate desuccinylase-like protein